MVSSPSHSQPEEDPTNNPNPTQDEEIQCLQEEDHHQIDSSPKPQTLDPPHEDRFVLDLDNHHLPAGGEEPGMSLSSPTLSIEPIKVPEDVLVNPPFLTSPTGNNPNRRPNKRKKLNPRKMKIIEKKVQTLIENLIPIPFVPANPLDFVKHEAVLKRLGLWDFVQIDFDRTIRVDIIAQLIVNYDPSKRGSYVNDKRIVANRADLSRCFKLPVVKKEKGSNVVEEVDLDSEDYSDEAISFIENFVSNWVVLHHDSWEMPVEVLNSVRLVKDGHPEKVDWAGLLWQMVEKELLQGEKLKFCFYASHLQYLIKSQREELFEEESQIEMEMDVKEEEDGGEGNQNLGVEDGGEGNQNLGAEDGGKGNQDLGADEGGEGNQDLGADDGGEGNQNLGVEENVLSEEPNIELTLGQDMPEKEEVKDDDMMDVEECKEAQLDSWFSNGKNTMGGHMLQRCDLVGSSLDGFEERKEEEEQGRDEEVEEEEVEEVEEEEDGFEIAPNDDSLDRDGLTGNLIQGMETTQIPFGLQGQLRDQALVDPFASNSREGTYPMSGSPLFFGHGGKREMEPEHDMSHYSLNVSNKRMRTDGIWDHKSSDFVMCMDQIQQLTAKAKMIYESKEQTYEETQSCQQHMLDELQQRSEVIEHLRRSKDIDIGKKDDEISRLENELYLMGNLLEGYRKALKDTQKAFSEYRQRYQLPEEPIYKDAGGGLVLSLTELEKRKQKQEEEDRLKRIFLEQKANEFLVECMNGFKVHLDAVMTLDNRLVEFEDTVKMLKGSFAQERAQKCQDIPHINGAGSQNSSDASELLVNDPSSQNPSGATKLLVNDPSSQNPSGATELLVNDASSQNPLGATELQVNDASSQNLGATELQVNDASSQNPLGATELQVNDASSQNPSGATELQVNDASSQNPSDATES